MASRPRVAAADDPSCLALDSAETISRFAASAVLTLVWRDWIDEVIGVDTDRHSGLLERTVVGTLVAATALINALAWAEWLRTAESEA